VSWWPGFTYAQGPAPYPLTSLSFSTNTNKNSEDNENFWEYSCTNQAPMGLVHRSPEDIIRIKIAEEYRLTGRGDKSHNPQLLLLRKHKWELWRGWNYLGIGLHPPSIHRSSPWIYGVIWSPDIVETSCVLLRQRMELHTSSWNCMQAYETSFKLMELHVSLCNCLQAYLTACKLM